MINNNIFYIHGGGDTIGGLETYLAQSLKHHEKYKPYLGIVKKGRFTDYIKELGIENVINLDGGRLRELHKTLKAVLSAVKFIKKNNRTPVLLVDDIAAELDTQSLNKALARLTSLKLQIFINSVLECTAESIKGEIAMFHVERGKVAKMIE